MVWLIPWLIIEGLYDNAFWSMEITNIKIFRVLDNFNATLRFLAYFYLMSNLLFLTLLNCLL